MSKDVLRYRRLERRLWMTRWRHEGEESDEEDVILDELELAWIDLSESEQAMLRTEGSRCWPADLSALPPQFAKSPPCPKIGNRRPALRTRDIPAAAGCWLCPGHLGPEPDPPAESKVIDEVIEVPRDHLPSSHPRQHTRSLNLKDASE